MRYRYPTVPHSHRRQAMSVVELLIAVTVVAILATMATMNYSAARQKSRDGRRKQDVQQYLSMLNSYRMVRGTSFVEVTKGGCAVPDETKTNTVNSDQCSGANGRSFGGLTLSGVQLHTRFAVSGPRQFKYLFPPVNGKSIAAVLAGAGFSATGASVTDPLAKSRRNSDTVLEDYVLVRCKTDGTQSFGLVDGSYAVWTSLERNPTEVEVENSAYQCGGSRHSGVPDASTVALYDFAISSSPRGFGNSGNPAEKAGVGAYTNWLEYNRKLYAVGAILK